MTDILNKLQWRGLIAQHTDIDALRAALAENPIVFYCGSDPTAASPHHGHLIAVKVMRHLQMAGHSSLALIGEATRLIGDPSGRKEGHNLNEADVVAGWAAALRGRLESLLDFGGEHPVRIINNLDWTGPMSTIGFLRSIGKNFRLRVMPSEDTAARRLESDEGISFVEFSYQILQANDYFQLYRRYGCTLEVGGNDQWGNLVGGMDLIRKAEGESVRVMTSPLITKSDGTKFGKTAGGAIWPNPEMFSPYRFYQFQFNTADDDAIHMLKALTFRTRGEIAELETTLAGRPCAREVQKAPTGDVTAWACGVDTTERVKATSWTLFGGDGLESLDTRTLAGAVAGFPRTEGFVGTPLIKFFVATSLEKGPGAVRRTVASGGLCLNNMKIDDGAKVLDSLDPSPGDVILLRREKENLAVVGVVQIRWYVGWGCNGDIGLQR